MTLGMMGRQLELQRRDLPVCEPLITSVIPSEQPRFPGSWERSHFHFITYAGNRAKTRKMEDQAWVNTGIYKICLFNVILIQYPRPVSFLNYVGRIIIRASSILPMISRKLRVSFLYFILRGFNSHLTAKISFFKHCQGVCSGFWRCQRASSLFRPFIGL